MKTKQEQIEEIAVIGCVRNPQAHTAEECSKCIFKQGMCNAYRHAEALVQAGYGDVSEYKAEIERLKAEFKQLETNAEILASCVMDLNHENYELTQKLAKQIRIARDANARFTGVEHYLKPFQYKADRLETKCNDLKKLSDWQREEIKRLKAEVNKGCDNCETIKQGQIDVLNELKTRHDYAIKNMGYPWDISQQIDELIKEVENE